MKVDNVEQKTSDSVKNAANFEFIEFEKTLSLSKSASDLRKVIDFMKT